MGPGRVTSQITTASTKVTTVSTKLMLLKELMMLVKKLVLLSSSTKELFTPLDNPKRVFRSKRRLFETLGLVESNSPEFNLFYDIEERLEEGIEEMTETMEQYMSKTHGDYWCHTSPRQKHEV
ncbi:hypothetical protein Tco_1363107 [Tanacetum coccineum]